MLRFFKALRREEGQTMAEYGVVLAVITIAVFGALALLSGNIVHRYQQGGGVYHLDPCAWHQGGLFPPKSPPPSTQRGST